MNNEPRQSLLPSNHALILYHTPMFVETRSFIDWFCFYFARTRSRPIPNEFLLRTETSIRKCFYSFWPFTVWLHYLVKWPIQTYSKIFHRFLGGFSTESVLYDEVINHILTKWPILLWYQLGVSERIPFYSWGNSSMQPKIAN